MSITKALNSKSNIKQFSNADLPVIPRQPVIARYAVDSTASQTVINLPWPVDTVNAQDSFFLYIDGKCLTSGAANDYTMTAIDSLGYSSQVTLTSSVIAGLNIQAMKLGLKKESEFIQDQRFTQLYAAQSSGFQGFVSQTDALMTATTTTGTPVAGTFYSSITGRASMSDLSQNLKTQMGVERIMVLNIQQLQTEFGPNGEAIYSTPNDQFGQIRYAGTWNVNGPNNTGQYIGTGTVNDFLEITFYGTGLNVLSYYDVAAAIDFRASIDGATEIATNLYGTVKSNVLISRNYSANGVFPVSSGLSLGVHTIKIRNNNAAGMYFFGFEILNESSTIKTNPGILYNQGKKISTSSQSSLSYNAPVTGTRGGRVVVYQNSDGTIGQAFQAVNAAQANYTSADHTNEEILRSYFPREFGAGRADDFSTLAGTGANRAFTLDDDTTTLIVQNYVLNTPGSQGEGLGLATGAGDYISLNFIGTGLDITNVRGTSGSTTYTVSIDGTNTITTTAIGGSGLTNTIKIVSGLPYGTHTCKIVCAAVSGAGLYVGRFIVYQPKKPSLPSGAIELADYNIMATYVANATSTSENIATGVLRKIAAREMVFTDGTGGTTSWTYTQNVTLIGGAQAFSDRLNASMAYTFFGTGCELRFDPASNRSANISVTLNGSAATTGNFATLVSSVYGTGVTFSAGTLDMQDASSTTGAGLSISGLPLALYTVKFNNNTASSFLVLDAIDVITPIHSVKSNIYSDIQNVLPVGSCGISDNRRLTPIKDALPATKAWAQAIGVTSNPTTTSTTYVPVPDMSLTIKTGGGPLDISYGITQYNASSAVQNFFQVYVDGIAIGIPQDQNLVSNQASYVGDRMILQVSAGVHKVDLYWKVGGSTATAYLNQRDLVVREI
jgi:hypothetical protein